MQLAPDARAALGSAEFFDGTSNKFSRSGSEEADEFYRTVIPDRSSRTDARSSCARRWPGCCGPSSFTTTSRTLAERRPGGTRSAARTAQRPQHEWRHLYNADVISMPDKWEYPWYAAWDLAFHCIALALVDPDFAKEQLLLMTARVVHAPQRAIAGLRMGLRRRQSAGARLGRLARLQRSR